MKLTATELAYVRSRGLYVTGQCDGCGKLLNQTFRHMIACHDRRRGIMGFATLAFRLI